MARFDVLYQAGGRGGAQERTFLDGEAGQPSDPRQMQDALLDSLP